MTPIGDLASTGPHRSLAWDGIRLAYLGGIDDTYLAFLTVEGQDNGHGPSLGVPDNVDRLIAVTPNGYHAAFRPPGGLPPLFVTVDRTGGLETVIDSHSPAPAGAFDLVERTDGAVLAWGYHASNFGDESRIGPPWQGIRYGGQPSSFGDAASDGTTVLAVGSSPVSAYDGKTVTVVPGVTGTALAVTWTGRAWQVVTLDGGDIDLVSLDASLSVTATERIFTIPPTGGTSGYVNSAEVAGDARRILVSFQFVATRGPQQQLVQLCR